MTRTVFANNRNFSHRGSGDQSVCSTPDICKTPIGSSTPPIPYPVISQARDASGYTTTVKIDGHATAIASSFHTRCTGDEAGSAKGIISGTTGSKTQFITNSFDVKCEGEGVVRHMDLTTMNNGNTLGVLYGTSTTSADVTESVDEDEGVFIDFYITDYEDERRIDETIVGKKVWLNVRTRNLVGELVTIELDEQSVAFKYQGDYLVEDKLKDYRITENHEKILVDVVEQAGEIVAVYFTDMNGQPIDEANPGDRIILNIETKEMIGELATIKIEEKTVSFKYKGEVLIDDILIDYRINNDQEQIVLDVVAEAAPNDQEQQI